MVEAFELGAVLGHQLVAVRQDAGFGTGVGQHTTGSGGQHYRLAGTSRCHADRIAVFIERRQGALDEQGLSRSEHHRGGSLLRPARTAWDGRRRSLRRSGRIGRRRCRR